MHSWLTMIWTSDGSRMVHGLVRILSLCAGREMAYMVV